jgi:UDP-N-acetylmuramoyl-L-alanyl-D-glutamate--2,6-diaminopimelate ligase
MTELLERVKRFPPVRLLYRVPWALRPYHYLLALAAAWWNGFPTRRMTVVGVTGTKGKTTTSNLVAQLLQYTGRKTGLATTLNFRIGDKEWVNETKQTMLGRFALQELLRQMRTENCRFAVVETSSEGIIQYRHRFVDYAVAVFTNISPEHIERHGSFENYRAAKLALFRQVSRKPEAVGVYNLDDQHAEYFLEIPMKHKYGFSLACAAREEGLAKQYGAEYFPVTDVKLAINRSAFTMAGERFETALTGRFNVYNAAAAICTAMGLGLNPKRIVRPLAVARPVPGRFEIVNAGQPFAIVVDYAHEPASLKAAYEAVKLFKPKHIIGVLGAQGGGRDVWKRPAMGRIAGEYCDEIILTTEDPYDEDPMAIMSDIKKGIYESQKQFKPVYKIPDRREAIRKALLLAEKGDAVVLTGKGGEVWMCLEKGRKISWNERGIVEELVNEEGDRILTRSGRNLRFEARDAETEASPK